MRSGASLSDLLVRVLVPVCIWGVMASLLMHLIDLRAVFVAGGETKLRQATLAFALGIILIQRLSYYQGRSVARAYGWALGGAITLFAWYHAYTYRLPIHPAASFLINEALLMVTWWVGARMTAACSVDDADQLATSGESGILSGRPRTPRVAKSKRNPETPVAAGQQSGASLGKTGLLPMTDEAAWSERLPSRHPGRILLYFSLVAVPVFGLGVYLFPPGTPSRVALGIYLFIYLWCLMALLFLASLNQVRAYFDQREVSLPETVGQTWLALGIGFVSLALIASVFLPQPASVANVYVRERILSAYHGWESSQGFKDVSRGRGKSGYASSRGNAAGQARPQPGAARLRQPGQPVPAQNVDEPVSVAGDPTAQQSISGLQEQVRNAFDFVVRIMLYLVYASIAFALLIAVWLFWRSLSESLAAERWRRKKKEKLGPRARQRRKKPAEDAGQLFPQFSDPFTCGSRTGDELVRYLWEAMLAFCADEGSPCAPDQTPLEYLGTEPPALKGFERQARYIADLFVFSEYSGQPVPDTQREGLQRFWTDLQRHAA